MLYWKFVLVFLFGVSVSINALANAQDCDELEIPITFDSDGLPIIELNVNGSNHHVLLDLGSSEGIHLPIAEIKNIPEIKYTGNTVKSSNISGDIYEAKEFFIPSLKIQCLTFDHIKGVELNPWAASIGENRVHDTSEQIVVGLDLFKNKTLLLNYSDKVLIIKSSEVKPLSLSITNPTSYTLSKEGLSIKVSSINASYQMVLDTGASSTIFVANKVNPKEDIKSCEFDLGPNMECKVFESSLKILGYNFQSNALLYPIDERFKMDGILGRDFFEQFVVEINFLNKTILLAPIVADNSKLHDKKLNKD